MSYFVYSIVSYLYANRSELITSVGEERTYLSAIVRFCSERFPFPLGTWDGLRYFIVGLTGPSV